MDVEKYLDNFINEIEDDNSVLRYVYNDKKNFVPFKTP